MGNIRARSDNEKLFFDFRYQNKRCREQTALDNTPANNKRLKKILEKVEAEITLGTFDYAKYFPNSKMVEKFVSQKTSALLKSNTPLFKDFTETWLAEMRIQWRESHYDTMTHTFKKHLTPCFGEKEVSTISKVDVLNFRASLAKVPGRNNGQLSATRINHIMTPLRMLLAEAADRFEFISPYRGIKSLKVPKTNVQPFTLDEVSLIITKVRKDFENYYRIRFFTGMRTSEIDGLQWKHVDFERRQILIREAWVKGKLVEAKNDGSVREIDMSQPIFDSLKEQFKKTKDSNFVFCNRNGEPLNANNITKRVWHPLLRHLNLERRRPYQTRHTTATLWLASGESPEWIARQMGHTTTEMLFRVYSRFVPNLTRQDGSAFERLLKTTY
ncbi:MAG: site-specific integrase [Pseudomonadota bacterium]